MDRGSASVTVGLRELLAITLILSPDLASSEYIHQIRVLSNIQYLPTIPCILCEYDANTNLSYCRLLHTLDCLLDLRSPVIAPQANGTVMTFSLITLLLASDNKQSWSITLTKRKGKRQEYQS